MPPALLTMAICCNAREVRHINLGRQEVQDSDRHSCRVLEEDPQEPNCRKLKCEAKATAVAPLVGNALPVLIAEVEVACQLVHRQ
jgi:hypothetical protein